MGPPQPTPPSAGRIATNHHKQRPGRPPPSYALSWQTAEWTGARRPGAGNAGRTCCLSKSSKDSWRAHPMRDRPPVIACGIPLRPPPWSWRRHAQGKGAMAESAPTGVARHRPPPPPQGRPRQSEHTGRHGIRFGVDGERARFRDGVRAGGAFWAVHAKRGRRVLPLLPSSTTLSLGRRPPPSAHPISARPPAIACGTPPRPPAWSWRRHARRKGATAESVPTGSCASPAAAAAPGPAPPIRAHRAAWHQVWRRR